MAPKGFFEALFGSKAPENKYTVANLAALHSSLARTAMVTDKNKDSVVESLRAISELIIWGDRHDPSIFEYVVEKNVLGVYWRIVERERTPISVKQQILQTLSILISNIEAGPSVYFILSNNHINELIAHPFDLSNEELLAHYVSLLKAIALRLDKHTVQFFIGEPANAVSPSLATASTPAGGGSSGSDGSASAASAPGGGSAKVPAATADDGDHAGSPSPPPLRPPTRFPLFDEAMKLWANEERMVRTAVRTIVLSICRVDDPEVRAFVARSAVLPKQLNATLRSDCHRLLATIRTAALARIPSGAQLASMEGALQLLLDEIYFCNLSLIHI